jgi:hypothetical protein
MLGKALLYIAIPFVLTTLFFGFYKGENDYYKGENDYYDSDDYDGNGTAH